MSKKNKVTNCRLGTVGGQAVLEGVMMKGKEKYSIAVRREDGSISLSENYHKSVRQKSVFLRIPIIRGIVGFVESMILNFKTLSISAKQYGGLDEIEPESRFEKWLHKKFGNKLMNAVMGFSMVFGIILAIALFLLLPSYATKLIDKIPGVNLGIWKSTVEGVIKIIIFISYLLLVSLMKDIRRTFEYHGAEHKSIFCYESGEELTVENVKKHRRYHPRCGTSFIFVVLIISILINSLPLITWDNMLLRTLLKLAMLPLIVGISFEFIMLAGKHNNIITRIFSAPGLWMQRITTREPDESQIECAIIALKSALPEEFPDFVHIDTHELDTAESVGEEDDKSSGIELSENEGEDNNEALES